MDFVEFLVGGVEEEEAVDVVEGGVLAELSAGGGVAGVGGLSGFYFDEGGVGAHLYEEIGADVVLGDAVVDVHRGALEGLSLEDDVALRGEVSLSALFAVAGLLHARVEDAGVPPAPNYEGDVGGNGEQCDLRDYGRKSRHD